MPVQFTSWPFTLHNDCTARWCDVPVRGSVDYLSWFWSWFL